MTDMIDTDIDLDRLVRSAKLARNDLALALKYLPRETHWRPYQSIRMITEDLGDREEFSIIWARWYEEDMEHEGDSWLPSFDIVMTTRDDNDYPF